MLRSDVAVPGSRRRLLILPVVVAATLSLVYLSTSGGLQGGGFTTGPAYVGALVQYQLVTLVVSGLVLLATNWMAPGSFRRFFRLGQLNAPVEPMKAIGLNPRPGESWLQVGRNFAVVISLVTFGFLYFTVFQGEQIAAQNLVYLPLVVPLALSNAFVEEMVTRFSIVASLTGVVPNQTMYMISAGIFGGAHFFGTPGGIAGALLAAFLGWLLAKSIAETQGIFWAWFIHFLQDLIIFTGLFFVHL